MAAVGAGRARDGRGIGFTIALLVARLGIPSFVVSLAYFLGLQGAMLLIIGEGGTIPIRNDAVLTIMNKNMPVGARLAAGVDRIGGFAGSTFLAIRTPPRAGLPIPAMSVWGAKVGALAVVVLVFTYLLNQERQRANAPIIIQGVPWVVPLVVVLVVGYVPAHADGFGRHVYAVGGNAEAARRAGIGVANIKTVVLHLLLDAGGVAGILIASRDNSVSPTTGGAQTLLYAVGAAVIGGTRCSAGAAGSRRRDRRPGRGDHRQRPAAGDPEVGIQFIINGLVLLLAASVDAISRRRAAATGRSIRWGILSTARIAEKLIAARASPRTPRSWPWARATRAGPGLRGRARHPALPRLLRGAARRPEVEAVYIPLPNSMHVEWSIEALEAGKHVLCEKPLARDPAQVDAPSMPRSAPGRLLMEAFMWRFHPQTERARRLVRGRGRRAAVDPRVVRLRRCHGRRTSLAGRRSRAAP